MKQFRWQIALGLGLVALSAGIYAFQLWQFKRTEDTFFYMMQDLAFVPIQVLLVSVVVTEILSYREKAALRKKLNMVIGTFFGEVGRPLLKSLSGFDTELDGVIPFVCVRVKWSAVDFLRSRSFLQHHGYSIDSRKSDLASLKTLLTEHRGFMLRLMENPNLLEHESFTELLWAVFHLTDELDHRKDFSALPKSDLDHLSGDIKRAYSQLLIEWVWYVKHLKEEYPYLFSLVVRTNPFDPEASPVVEENP